MNLMLNTSSSKWHHTPDIIQLCQDSYWHTQLSTTTATIVLMCQLLYNSSNRLKSQNLFFWLKTKNPQNKLLILLKIFLYLLIFPSTNLNLVTCLALYKEDQANTLPRHLTHITMHLSHTLLFWNFNMLLPYTHFHTSPSLLQNLSS